MHVHHAPVQQLQKQHTDAEPVHADGVLEISRLHGFLLRDIVLLGDMRNEAGVLVVGFRVLALIVAEDVAGVLLAFSEV